MTALGADEIRRRFTRFFVERDHLALPPASLVPNDPTVMFTIAGMVPFKPYFLGTEEPPAPRATTVQPCFRTPDIDLIGTTPKHVTFFEMLGNFSFGDYFKERAIPWAWELVTEVLGFDAGDLWVTVHVSDDEAIEIWRDSVGFPLERIQRLEEDNFWRMGDTGPCGPCSEIHLDRGPRFGEGGGPGHGAADRYVELWNLVFMQYDRRPDGVLGDLPRRSIDTGAGLERLTTELGKLESVFDTDVLAPLVDAAAAVTGRVAGRDREVDVGLRILADHARSATFLVSDGVLPRNDGRGYVLRRVIRRAVLRAHRLGVSELVMPQLVATVVDVMGGAYPRLARDRSFVERVLAREEESFRRTLRQGTALLEEELEAGVAADLMAEAPQIHGTGAPGEDRPTLPGAVAFKLHDTHGFPIDLTVELAGERGFDVDRAGFDTAMAEQRRRAREHGRAGPDAERDLVYRQLLEDFGPTEFLGYREYQSAARVLAVEERDDAAEGAGSGEEPAGAGGRLVEIVLDRTPFYPEGGGQVGDTGEIVGPSGRAHVVDTNWAITGVIRHLAVVEGAIEPGEEVTASIDAGRREAIRRNHTGTHLLHWALRKVLGDHVKQQGSLVAPDRLRFDFSHFAALSEEEIAQVEDLVNSRVLADEPVQVFETSMHEAEELGAIAFFGDKYGDTVRVVEAGEESIELCGGTHVSALGMIGPLVIVSEGSIGSNTRRVEALTGSGSLARLRELGRTLDRSAELLRAAPAEVPEAIDRLVKRERASEEELRALRAREMRSEARQLAANALEGVGRDGGSAPAAKARLVARRDGLAADQLRELALAVRSEEGIEAAALVGSPDGARVALVVAVEPGSGLEAGRLAGEAARAVGGGGGGRGDVATAGGSDIAGIDAAIGLLEQAFATNGASSDRPGARTAG